ncbi:tRNA (adenosine(37)-N6)-dimethylallyltransferase MiaA [Maritimibacter dapengensis]|uniref:tRNA dimethylallyltransferase n=1 Tax=Maritimibacter dapengensis TaxID=2836868 RepID=A0ABS6T560_9RHOB|nr:tRNA (adenosine(37)-N6)-dimethylallyltransferase MiaA [Maritimibacter dapengensis]MBV7379502.1 tRNA (adenosine(37)-N6)-dimethylallyltransferase MiaA [Maritimibacter dapengensis]
MNGSDLDDTEIDALLDPLPPSRPVLIAGPTASGKSGLALRIAREHDGVIVNADALQVYENWRILTARPSPAEEEVAKHELYGFLPADALYSVGDWLRDLEPILQGDRRPIIVGGTGLYFSALTEGLAEIPPTPGSVRQEGEARLAESGIEALLAELDPDTLSRIDTRNPARVARAWEVQKTTGRGLADWQDDTPAPRLELSDTLPLVLMPERDWLRDRIARRFDAMLAAGALEEARANMDNFSPDLPSAKAIGAKELIAHLRGTWTIDEAREASIVSSQQYAKRQRTWFRSRMSKWHQIPLPGGN